jgi:lysophospholipase L1-like esterase
MSAFIPVPPSPWVPTATNSETLLLPDETMEALRADIRAPLETEIGSLSTGVVAAQTAADAAQAKADAAVPNTTEGRQALADSDELKHTFGARVSVLAHGAAADGVADDWAAFVTARTAAGAEGVVYFPARAGASETVYFLDEDRPDLSGARIFADPGVVIRLPDENPNTKTLNLLTPVTFENIEQGIVRTKPANIDNSALAAFALAGGAQYEPLAFTAVDFTDGWSVGEFTGGPVWGNSGSYTGSVASSKLHWTSAFGSNAQGIHAPCLIGDAYEFTFETTEETTAAGYVGVMVGSNASVAQAVEWRFNVDSATVDRYVTGMANATLTVPTNNGKTYQLPLQPAPGLPSALIVRVVIVSSTLVEVYANGMLVDRYTAAFSLSRIGAFASAAASADASIERAIIYSASHAAKHRHSKVLVIGDSQSYGAWSALALEDLLPVALASVTGGGTVEVTNVSVSGTSAQAWVSGGALVTPDSGGTPIDVSEYDYVLINLGTNNVQGGAGQGTFATAIGSLTTSIRGQGAEPIYGLFPAFTTVAISGAGVATTRQDQLAAYRTILIYHCALNGLQLADVSEQFANGISLYLDNIHPGAFGQALMARAFAQAIARKRGGADDRTALVQDGPWATIPSGWYTNSWVSGPSAAGQYRVRANGDVELRGRINGGAAPSAAITFPANLRPLVAGGFAGRALQAGTEVAGTLGIGTTGALTVNIGSSGTGSTTFTSLDGCRWSTT